MIKEGDKAIFGLAAASGLASALKGFFYELSIRSGEPYQQFAARFDANNRKMKEQEIMLPDAVLGFMFIKKLRMDSNQESMIMTMIMTATKGKLELKPVLEAVRAIFPEGKGSVRNTKKIFQAEVEEPGSADVAQLFEGSHGDGDMKEVLEIITDPCQDSGDEEEALECYESYVEVRRKLQETKNSRGFATSGS